jgi:hypothetical protein
LAFGDIVESEVLRAMEEAAQDDPPKLQTAFDVYDGCSGKSGQKSIPFSCNYFKSEL